MQCPNCEELIPDDVTVCPSCGAELPEDEARPEAVEADVEEAEDEAVEDAVAVEPEGSDVDDGAEQTVEAESAAEVDETAEAEPAEADVADESEADEAVADEVESAGPETVAQPQSSYKWVFVGASAVLMLLLAFAPWIGLPGSLVSSLESDETTSMMLSFVGVDLHAIAYTLLSGGLAINNNLVPLLHNASELGANFGLDLSAFDAYAGRLQMAGTLLVVLWAVNMAALAYALYCDVAGRKPFRWAYPLLVVTCALVLVVLFVGIQRLTQGDLGETFENMGPIMDVLQPGYWLTLVGAIAATVARFVLGRQEN